MSDVTYVQAFDAGFHAALNTVDVYDAERARLGRALADDEVRKLADFWLNPIRLVNRESVDALSLTARSAVFSIPSVPWHETTVEAREVFSSGAPLTWIKYDEAVQDADQMLWDKQTKP